MQFLGPPLNGMQLQGCLLETSSGRNRSGLNSMGCGHISGLRCIPMIAMRTVLPSGRIKSPEKSASKPLLLNPRKQIVWVRFMHTNAFCYLSFMFYLNLRLLLRFLLRREPQGTTSWSPSAPDTCSATSANRPR